MILTESLTINNKQFTKTYSDAGFMIERVEQLTDVKSAYEVAVDKTIIRFKK